MSMEESVLCTSSSRLAVTLGRVELLSVWEGEQLQQLEWCRLLQSCCWMLQSCRSCRHMQDCTSQGQRSRDLQAGWDF